MMIALPILLASMVGCQKLHNHTWKHADSVRRPTLNRVRVAHWLDGSRLIDVTEPSETLAGLLSRTDTLSRRSRKGEIDRLTEQAIDRQKTLANSLPERSAARKNVRAKANSLAQLKGALEEDMIIVSRGARDWVIPTLFLVHPAIAAIPATSFEAVTTRPARATNFYQSTKTEKDIEIYVSGPFARFEGPLAINRTTANPPLTLNLIRSDSLGIRTVDGRLFFHGDSSAKDDRVVLCDNPLSDVLVISRLSPDGRIASLILPSKNYEEAIFKASFTPVSDNEFRLTTGDAVEFTNLDMLVAQYF